MSSPDDPQLLIYRLDQEMAPLTNVSISVSEVFLNYILNII